jgi:hypothetical protein
MDQQELGPMDDDAVDTALSSDLEDASKYIDTELGPLRALAIHYYHARQFGDEEQGRSQVVMPVVRDTIRATLPSLMKKFFGSRQVVTFSPGSTKGGEFADDATATVNYVFSVQNEGYMVLWGAFKDALRSKSGWLKWWWDESVTITAKYYSGVTEEQLQATHATLEKGEELSIESKNQVGTQQVPDPNAPPPQMPPQMPGAPPQPPPQPQMMSVPVFEYSICVKSRKPKNRVRVACVPPDEILFGRDAMGVDGCRLIAHRTRKSRGELVAMGVSPADLDDVTADDVDTLSNVEYLARQTIPSGVQSQASNSAWSQVMVPYYECYYQIDQDGDGISELRKICKLGINGKIVSNKIFNEVPLAQLCPDPEPHVMVGNSQADFIMDVQNINSHVWRDMLDSLKQSIFPRMAYVEGQANLDDVLNTEIGAAIRQRAPGMVQPLVVPFTGGEALPILSQLDQVREQRTGVGNSAMALDGAALQSTTPVAAQATVTAAQAQVDLTARMFAAGVARMFRGVLRLLVDHQNNRMQFDLNGRTFNVNPLQWDPDMHAVVDTGLGVGNSDVKIAALGATSAAQKDILMTLGVENPLCGLQEYYNGLVSLLNEAGVRDSHRYWRDPTVSKQQGITIQPPKPSPEQVIAEAQVKIEGAKLDKDKLKIILDDEFRHEELQINSRLQAAQINAEYGANFDAKQIDALIAREKNQTAVQIEQMQPDPTAVSA